jgi:hypothetical protein
MYCDMAIGLAIAAFILGIIYIIAGILAKRDTKRWTAHCEKQSKKVIDMMHKRGK